VPTWAWYALAGAGAWFLWNRGAADTPLPSGAPRSNFRPRVPTGRGRTIPAIAADRLTRPAALTVVDLSGY